MKTRITTISLLMMLTVAVNAHQGNPDAKEIDFSVTKLTDNISVLMGVNGFTGGNIAILTGDDGVIMIDDSMPPLADKLKAAIKKVTDKPIDFIINTHVRGDHIANNETFAQDGTWVVGHEKIRARQLMSEQKVADKMLPVITFRDQMTFHLNGHTAKIIHVPASHTDGDAFIHYKDVNIIHTGDLHFNYLFPFIDIDRGGDVDNYIAAQKRILAMANDDTKIIPGHGPMASKADLEVSIAMLEDSRDLIQALIDSGMSEDDVVKKNPLQKYDDWTWRFITTEKMTRQIYKGLL